MAVVEFNGFLDHRTLVLVLRKLINWSGLLSHSSQLFLLHHCTWLTRLFLSIEDVLKPVSAPWHVDLRISLASCASICRTMLLHSYARDVTFANSPKWVSNDAPRVPRYCDNHPQSLWIPCMICWQSSELVTVSSQCLWWYPRSRHQTSPAFPRTRHLISILVPPWLGFEAGFGNGWPHQSMPFLQRGICYVDSESCLPVSTNGTLRQTPRTVSGKPR